MGFPTGEFLLAKATSLKTMLRKIEQSQASTMQQSLSTGSESDTTTPYMTLDPAWADGTGSQAFDYSSKHPQRTRAICQLLEHM